jgi:DNA-binding CsgD family transcriptional regulator
MGRLFAAEAEICMQTVEDVIGAFEQCRTAMSVLDTVRATYDLHATYHLAQTVAAKVDSPFVRTTYPTEWVARYLLAGYVKADPIAMAGFERVLPFDWSEVEPTPSAVQILQDAMSHGLGPSGYSIPIIDRFGRRALFSINSRLEGDAWRAFIRAHQEEIVEIAHIAHRLAVQELYGDQEPPHLTTREREVLLWTARGKDYKAIAIIVGISPHTAKAYLKSARHKLDCATLSQAVAKAMSLRMISE